MLSHTFDLDHNPVLSDNQDRLWLKSLLLEESLLFWLHRYRKERRDERLLPPHHPSPSQLPNSNLNYEEYSEFVHPLNVSCREFSVSKNYADLDDLKKIDAINSGEQHSEEESESEEVIIYTCIRKKCKIPCLIAQFVQCKEHIMRHSKLFDDAKDSMVIRSDEEFCINESFLSSSYLG